MEEKHINKILNFSSDIICNAKELVINKKQAFILKCQLEILEELLEGK